MVLPSVGRQMPRTGSLECRWVLRASATGGCQRWALQSAMESKIHMPPEGSSGENVAGGDLRPPAGFPMGSASRKPAWKVANGSHMTAGQCKHNGKPVHKYLPCNHVTVGML